MPGDATGRAGEPSPDQAADVIIRSKVRAPVVRDSTLARPRLLGWLDQHADERVRLLAAEAGFGKTTLLADWARRTTRPVRWLKLDPADAEWASFISYLIAAFQEGSPEFGGASQRLLGHVATLGITPQQVTGQFLAELGSVITEPSVLILDDLQHVQGNAEVRAILERVIERAPAQLTFILSGRSKPDLRLGRLTAQGSVVALGTDDLRFTRQETGDLFAQGYQMPLDGDLVGMVDARTEGWGASLQLLYSSLRGQRPAEVRDFIHSLEGSQQPLYDFLAEEVLGRQSALMQAVLLHAAILDRIVPRWVSAALSVTDDPPHAEVVVDTLDSADELGLMSRNSELSASRRFHPLLREFLASHLLAITPPETLRLMHLRVAEAAESMHWPTSGHHYIEAGEGEQAMRVIGDATITALGTGAWGAAIKLIERIPEIEPTPPVKVLKARGLSTTGHAEQAIALLEAVDLASVPTARDRALVRLTLANALTRTSRDDEVLEVLRGVVADDNAPTILSALARAWIDLITVEDNLTGITSMRGLVAASLREGLPMFAALACHNLSVLLLAIGDFDASMAEAKRALEQFGRTEDDEGAVASTHLALAHALFEKGLVEEAHGHARKALAMSDAQPDVYAEAAMLLVWTGRTGEAAALLESGWSVLRSKSHQVSVADALHAGDATVLLAHGDPVAALSAARLARTPNFDQNQSGTILTLRAVAVVATDAHGGSVEFVSEVMAELTRRRILRWLPHLQLLKALASGNAASVLELLEGRRDLAESVLLVVADAMAPMLCQLEDVPETLGRHVRKWPARWRPILRRVVTDAKAGSGFAAATLLASVGEGEDVPRLLLWEKRQKRTVRDRRFSETLARRISPTLMIRDLGRASISLAARRVRISDVRRRAATLLLYLVSRPRHSATREQVFDALWPDQGPELAANSLHQTLYFLRRELVVRPRDSKPLVDYVPVESDLIYLVPELVHVDSAAFLRQASELRSRNPGAPEAVTLIQSYGGRFAPEFEYEEWAIGWRDQVHSVFLDLAEQAARARLPGRAAEATAILRHALEIDPTALELKALLAVAMHLSGSHAAARILYQQYCAEHEKEFGEVPPPLKAVLNDIG